MTTFDQQPDPVRFLLAGTAGGVGTTTVTALLFAAIADRGPTAPVLLDHTAGSLGHRLADSAVVHQLENSDVVHDLGPNAVSVGLAQLGDPAAVLIVVGAATPWGCRLAAETVQAIRSAHGPEALSRTVLSLVGVYGRTPIKHPLAGLASSGVRAVLSLPADPVLAVGELIPTGRLSRETQRFGDQLLRAVQHDRSES